MQNALSKEGLSIWQNFLKYVPDLPEQRFNALPAGGAAAVGQEHLPYPRQVVEVLEGEQPRPDPREQPGEVEGVRGEGHEGAEAEDAVRVRPEEVGLARVEVGGLDQSGGEVVGEVAVDEAAPEVSVAEMRLNLQLFQFYSKKVKSRLCDPTTRILLWLQGRGHAT